MDNLGVSIDNDTKQEIVRQLQKEIDLPVHRVDFFYSGSMVHIDEVGQLHLFLLPHCAFSDLRAY